MDGKWERRGKSENVYDNEWLKVDVAKVELPDGTETEQHVVVPKYKEGVSTVCHDPDKGVLMMWRHRFVVDEWGWELPGGGVDGKELPEKAARRETEEETGWKPASLTSFLRWQPFGPLVVNTHEAFFSNNAEWVGPGRDVNEANDVAWIGLDQLRTFIRKGEIKEGVSLAALLFALEFGPLSDK